MKNRCIYLVLALCLLLSSCTEPISDETKTSSETTSESEASLDWGTPPYPISDKLISIKQRRHNYCELSETGVYALILEKAGYFLFYCDNDSDTFVRVCGRPDCLHNSEDCDAYLFPSINAAGGFAYLYYNGLIYYVEPEIFEENSPKPEPMALWQMDPDGRNKTMLMYLYEISDIMGQRWFGSPKMWNGYLWFNLALPEADGVTVRRVYYCTLENPSTPEVTAPSLYFPPNTNYLPNFTFGRQTEDSVLLSSSPLNDTEYIELRGRQVYRYNSYYEWDPRTNSMETFGDVPYGTRGAYYTKEGGIFYKEGVLYNWDYATYTATPIVDLGTRDNRFLQVYPRFFVLYDYYYWDDDPVSSITLTFYNWHYELLGECTVPLKEEGLPKGGILYAETENRILLCADTRIAYPTHYIEKSEIASGDIHLYEYHYPELDLAERDLNS